LSRGAGISKWAKPASGARMLGITRSEVPGLLIAAALLLTPADACQRSPEKSIAPVDVGQCEQGLSAIRRGALTKPTSGP